MTEFPLAKAQNKTHCAWLIAIGEGVSRLVLIVLTFWALGALYFDFPFRAWHAWAAGLYAGTFLIRVAVVDRHFNAVTKAMLAGGFLLVLAWWLTLQPSNDRSWQPDVAETGWAEVAGEQVTIHNFRNCEYRTETDYTPHWETRTVDLSHLQGIDLAINYWGSAWMAHPILSFQFDNGRPVCFSIETRKEAGESYSAVGGLYRQYELIYVCADERDVVRVRTNYRHGEEIYLYRTKTTPEQARERFREYLAAMNELHAKPRWYNAATTNCTTSIRTQRAAAERAPWDWRILFNGYADKMLYERGVLAGGLPFAELKQQARINEAAQAADAAPDFSQRIRAGRPGFQTGSAAQP